ncbi:hypothetical protein RN22_06005 [Grimontia sp. AD028]|uniref:LysR family transcriptional regulator n=1 Tax=Grimontia sp. AD028 TaxID=1581149 RepID=UPI00061AA0C0|nr:LysR family transcriptional regulator [Grimontia sp. AD028]KKD61401.1 hypothetical protein RN22_06005 [Grimontia sp. AD028]
MEQLHLQLPNVYIFRLVSELGSFQAAATQLNIPRSSVSKKVAQLEDYLQQRLLQRSTRNLKLTEDGLRLLKATSGLEGLLSGTRDILIENQAEPVGRVTLSTSSLIGQQYLTPHIKMIRAQYPKVTLHISYSDDVEDLLDEGIDIAIRTGKLPDSSLVARSIGWKDSGCFASPDYLACHGEPKTPDALREHDCLVFKNNKSKMNHWQFESKDGGITSIAVEESIVANSGRALIDMAVHGLGIVHVDRQTVEAELQSGYLVPILEHFPSPARLPIQLVCLGKHTRSKAVDAVWNYLSEALPAQLS